MVEVLLVEPDEHVSAALSAFLRGCGYDVTTVRSVGEARATIAASRPACVVVELDLPDEDGLVLISWIIGNARAPTNAPGILAISGRGQHSDATLALKLGADDFLSKPFDISELQARLARIIARTMPRAKPREGEATLVVGSLVIAPNGGVSIDRHPVQLTPTEFHLLKVLAERADQIITRAELGAAVWGYSAESIHHLINTHMWRLRQKLRRVSGMELIRTVRAQGFQLSSAPIDEQENRL